MPVKKEALRRAGVDYIEVKSGDRSLRTIDRPAGSGCRTKAAPREARPEAGEGKAQYELNIPSPEFPGSPAALPMPVKRSPHGPRTITPGGPTPRSDMPLRRRSPPTSKSKGLLHLPTWTTTTPRL